MRSHGQNSPRTICSRLSIVSALILLLLIFQSGPTRAFSEQDLPGDAAAEIPGELEEKLAEALEAEAERLSDTDFTYAPVSGLPEGLAPEKVQCEPVEHFVLQAGGTVQAGMIVRLTYEDREIHQLWNVMLAKNGDDWSVNSPELVQTADNYFKRSVSDESFSVIDFHLDQDLAQFYFESANVSAVTVPDGRIVGAMLSGDGRFTFQPLDRVEEQQLKVLADKSSLDEPMDRMILFFHPSRYEEIFPPSSRMEVSPDFEIYDHRSLFSDRDLAFERTDRFFGVYEEPEELFVDFRTKKYDWLAYAFDPDDIKECQLYNPERVAGITAKQYYRMWSHYHSREDRETKTPYELEKETPARINTLSLHLEPTLTRKSVLQGRIQMEYVVVAPEVHKTNFRLHKNLKIKYVLDGKGRPLLHVGDEYARTLYLREPLVESDTDRFVMKYEGEDVIRQYTPDLYSLAGFAGSWFPSWEFWGNKKLDLTLTVRVPKGLDVLSVGQQVKEWTEDKYDVKEFRPGFPVVTPVIVFGNFDRTSEVVDRIPVNVYLSKSGLSASGFGGPIPTRRVKSVLADAANSVRLYNKWFGRYPFGKLDLVNSIFHGFGAQAPPSIIFIGNGLFSTQSQRAHIFQNVNAGKGVVAHEVGHEWWGHVVRPISDLHYWWVESLAQVAEALFLEEMEGEEAYRNELTVWGRRAMEGDKWGTLQNGYRAGRKGVYLIYSKGPYVFHMLRQMGGDSQFRRFLHHVVEEHYGEAICSRDLQIAAEKIYGWDMEFFFDQWIRGSGIPRYDWGYEVNRSEEGKWVVRGRIHQRIFIGEELQEGTSFSMPLKMRIYTGDEVKTERVFVKEPLTEFAFSYTDKPKRVTLNEEGSVLAETQEHKLSRLDKASRGSVKIGTGKLGSP